LSGIIPMATVVATDVIQTLKKTELIKAYDQILLN